MRASELASRAGAGAAPELDIECTRPWLRVRFPTPHRTLGWTIVGGGYRESAAVSWLEVDEHDLAPPIDPRKFVRGRLAATGRAEEPVLMTGCAVADHVVATAHVGAVRAACVATVGLGNALRAGDPPDTNPRPSTINLLCVVSLPLTDVALLEALTIAVEARTTAVLEGEIPSAVTGRRATGTGTDCAVVACPAAGMPAEYAGKHTDLGAVVGAAVLEAVTAGVDAWCARNRPK